ncbi:MAG: recombinase family protein [Acidimicrobiales bacterium]
MKRAVIYTRISEDRDGTKDSPETQERECRDYCARQGWSVVDVYCDRDKSAYKRGVHRPEFDRLMNGIRAGRADVLVAYKLDRVTRGGITSIGPILQDLQDADADLAFVHDNVDTTTPMGEGVLGLLASMAKQESMNISTRVKSASVREAEAGKYPSGGVRTFGYTKTGEPIAEEAAVVTEVTQMVLDGVSLRRIATDLNGRGVGTAKGNAWSSATVGQMIQAPRLAGVRIRNGEVYPGRWKGILTLDQHLAVRAALARPPAQRRAVRRHLLTGRIECGLCGGPLKTMGWRMKNGRTFPRYQCVKQPGAKNCGGVATSKDSLDRYVVEQVLDFLADSHLKALSSDKELFSRLQKDLAADEASVSELTRDRYVTRTIDDRAYRLALGELNERIERLHDQVEAMARQRDALSPIPVQKGNRDELQSWWDTAPIEDRRAAIAESVYKVIIHPAKVRGGNKFDTSRVEIRWRWDLYVRASEAAWDSMSDEEKEEAQREAELDFVGAANTGEGAAS